MQGPNIVLAPTNDAFDFMLAQLEVGQQELLEDDAALLNLLLVRALPSRTLAPSSRVPLALVNLLLSHSLYPSPPSLPYHTPPPSLFQSVPRHPPLSLPSLPLPSPPQFHVIPGKSISQALNGSNETLLPGRTVSFASGRSSDLAIGPINTASISGRVDLCNGTQVLVIDDVLLPGPTVDDFRALGEPRAPCLEQLAPR